MEAVSNSGSSFSVILDMSTLGVGGTTKGVGGGLYSSFVVSSFPVPGVGGRVMFGGPPTIVFKRFACGELFFVVEIGAGIEGRSIAGIGNEGRSPAHEFCNSTAAP
jgi:hypothetical protein